MVVNPSKNEKPKEPTEREKQTKNQKELRVTKQVRIYCKRSELFAINTYSENKTYNPISLEQCINNIIMLCKKYYIILKRK